MDLVVDKVMQLQHVDIADGDLAIELVAGAPVEQFDLARRVETGQFQHVRNVRFTRAIEHRGRHRHAAGKVRCQFMHLLVGHPGDVAVILAAINGLQLGTHCIGIARRQVLALGIDVFQHRTDLLAEAARGPAEMGFKDLANVHARRDAQRVEHDINRRTIGEEGHVLLRQDTADDALVAVPAGHLVTRLQLALHRDEHLDHLEHARRQFVARLQLALLVVEPRRDQRLGIIPLRLQGFEIGLDAVIGDAELPPFKVRMLFEQGIIDDNALLDTLGDRDRSLADQAIPHARISGTVENGAFVGGILFETLDFLAFDLQGTFVLVDAMAVEDSHLDNRTGNAGRQLQRRIAHVRCLFTEDGAQQFFFRRHRRFTLGGDLADQDIARLHFGADIDNAGLVEVAQRFLTDIGNVAGDVLGAELGISGHHFEFFDVDRGEDVFLDDLLVDQDRIFVIVAIPRHERDKGVTAQRQFAIFGRRAIGDDIALRDQVTHLHQRALVDAGVLVRALKLHQRVDVDTRFARFDFVGGADDDTCRIDLIDDARTAGADRSTRIARYGAFHAGADERCLGLDQRHRLALHVRTHQRAVGVIIFKERNQRRGDRHQLLGRNVHQRDLVLGRHQEFAGFACRDQILGKAAIGIRIGVGLSDRVLGFFHCRQIDNVVGQLVVDDLAIWRFDEAILVDAAESGQRVDQADVRAFRRLDRADAAIMGRVNVADFEAGAFAGQTAGAEGRNAALVGDFRQRVGLIHELRQLRGTEEFAHRGNRRLGVDQVVGHDRVDIDRRHALLDGALHAQQADAILVLEKFADRANTAVAEVVDVVDLALAVLEVDQRLDDFQDVLAAQYGHVIGDIKVETHVHLDAADSRKIVAVGVEEQAIEHGFGGFARRRLTRTHDTIDFGKRVVALLDLVGHQRVADPRTNRDMIDIEQFDRRLARLVDPFQVLGGQFVAGFDIDFAGGFVDQVKRRITAEDFLGGDQQVLQPIGHRLAGDARRDLGAKREDDFTGFAIDDVEGRLLAAPVGFDEGHDPTGFTLGAMAAHPGDAVVEGVEDFFRIPV